MITNFKKKHSKHKYNTRRQVTLNEAVKKIQKIIRGMNIRKKWTKLKKYKICSICLENLNYINSIFLKNCEHVFHKQCISRWYRVENYCPNCRTTLSYEEMNQEPSLLTNFMHIFLRVIH